MKRIINIVSIILLTFSIIVSLFVLTLFNNRFVNKAIPSDIKTNIVSNCNSYEIKSRCVSNYLDVLKNIYEFYNYIYILVFIIIIITGLFFLKFKLKQNIDKILFITSFLLIIFYGAIKIFFNSESVVEELLIKKYNYYNLIIGVVILEYEIIKTLKPRIKK